MQMLQNVANLNQTQNQAQQTAIQNEYLPSALNSANQTAAFLAKNPILHDNPQIGTTLALGNGSFDKNGLPTTLTDTSQSQSSDGGSGMGAMFNSFLNKIMPGRNQVAASSQPLQPSQNSSLSGSFPNPYANNAAISQNGSAPIGSGGLASATAMNNLQNKLLYNTKINDAITSYQAGLPKDQVAADSARANTLYGDPHTYFMNRALGNLSDSQQDQDAQAKGYPDFASVPGQYPQSAANVTQAQAKAIGDAGFNAAAPIVSKGLASFSSPLGQHILLSSSLWGNWINQGGDKGVQSQREDTLGQALAARTIQQHQNQLSAMLQGGSITDASVAAQAKAMGDSDFSGGEFASTPGLYQKYQYYLTQGLNQVLDAQQKQVLAKDTLNPSQPPSENQFKSAPQPTYQDYINERARRNALKGNK